MPHQVKAGQKPTHASQSPDLRSVNGGPERYIVCQAGSPVRPGQLADTVGIVRRACGATQSGRRGFDSRTQLVASMHPKCTAVNCQPALVEETHQHICKHSRASEWLADLLLQQHGAVPCCSTTYLSCRARHTAARPAVDHRGASMHCEEEIRL